MKLGIIDDNKIVLQVTQLMLRKQGFILSNDEINTFIDLSSFLPDNLNSVDSYDLITCDYDLGRDSINGLIFLRKLRTNGFKGVCVLLTGDDTPTLRANMQMNPSIFYVVKNTNNDKNSTFFQLGRIIENTRNNLEVK